VRKFVISDAPLGYILRPAVNYAPDPLVDSRVCWLKRRGLTLGGGGFVDIATHLGGQIARNKFWGVNKRFQAKRPKIQFQTFILLKALYESHRSLPNFAKR